MIPSTDADECDIERCPPDMDYLLQLADVLTDAQLAGLAPRPDQPLITRHELIKIVKDMFVIQDSSAIKKVAHMYDHGLIGKTRGQDDAGKSTTIYWVTDRGCAMIDNRSISPVAS